MENKIILSKESNVEDIKRYFEAVLKLSQSDDKFPINLDEVWMLVYTKRDKATEALKENFFEGEDFYLTQMGKVIQSTEIQNGIKVEYKLTTSCMEYFIARKVRPVFEVYRQVFHKSIEVVKQLAEPKSPKPSDLPVEDQFKLMTMVCKEVNATKAEKRNAFNNLLAQNGLPQITASERTEAKTGKEAQSATDLLTFHKIGIGARKFFDLLEEHGYAVKNTRSTTKTRSGKSNYSVLTEKGLKWGYNDPSKYAGNKYDVYFYTDKFPELLKELGLK